jgi:holliday junction DNA helicase RuvA
MIAQIKGSLIELTPAYVVIDCSGVGYHVAISLSTYSAIQNQTEIKLHTRLIVREDAHLLFGFYTKEEREVFNLLISVGGIGPASGLVVLSTLSVGQVIQAIQNEESKVFESVKGIGNKTAQRIVLDLKDKVAKQLDGFSGAIKQNRTIENDNRKQALQALESLGVASKQGEKLIDQVIHKSPEASLEQIIKEVLKSL